MYICIFDFSLLISRIRILGSTFKHMHTRFTSTQETFQICHFSVKTGGEEMKSKYKMNATQICKVDTWLVSKYKDEDFRKRHNIQSKVTFRQEAKILESIYELYFIFQCENRPANPLVTIRNGEILTKLDQRETCEKPNTVTSQRSVASFLSVPKPIL